MGAAKSVLVDNFAANPVQNNGFYTLTTQPYPHKKTEFSRRPEFFCFLDLEKAVVVSYSLS